MRRSLSTLLSIVLIAFSLLVDASSTRPRPLKRLSHASSVGLDIVRRQPAPHGTLERRSFPLDSPELAHSDSLRLTLSAFSQNFNLHLRPNEDLIHPAARINYVNSDGTIIRSEPLLRESVKVYWGEVVHDDDTARRFEEESGGVYRPFSGTPGDLGWARITVHSQGDPERGIPPVFEGAFSVNGDIHHVSTTANYLRNKHHYDPDPIPGADSELVVFRDSDLLSAAEEEARRTGRPVSEFSKFTSPQTCSHDKLDYNIDEGHPVMRYGAGFDRVPPPPWYDPLGLIDSGDRWGATNTSLIRRQGDVGGGGMTPPSNFVGTIGQTAGCPRTQKIVYMGVASDCTYTSRYGSSQNATTQILTNWNTASLLFKSTFNVSLGIVELQIFDQNCPTTATRETPWNVACSAATLNERLSLFSQWRGDKGASDGAGLWHLMSGCPTGTEVGVAWLGTVCLTRAGGTAPQVVSGAAVSTAGRTEWQVVAHEIGHNFGAIHDCSSGCSLTDNCCPRSSSTCDANAGFLMSPVSSATEQGFSPCSIGNICSLMLGSNVDTSCIQDPDPNRQTFSLQMCGNGIVEAGEDCDPGSGANSACCDPATCRFRANAQCDPSSSSCCTEQCQFAPTTQVCRPSRDSACDMPEMCTGNSSACPSDLTRPNGVSCGNDGLACAMGICTSVSEQCKIVGASMGLTKACPQSNDRSCQLSCQDPRNPNQCIVLQSQLIDGSPCGYGGTCMGGTCQSGSPIETAKAWYTQNLQIAIPVTVVVGIVALLLLYSFVVCLKRCCCGRKMKQPRTTEPPLIPPSVPAQRIPSWTPPPPQQSYVPNSLHPGNGDPFPRYPTGRVSPVPYPPVARTYGNHERQQSWGGGHDRRSLIDDQHVGSYDPYPRNGNQSHWVDDTQWNGPRR